MKRTVDKEIQVDKMMEEQLCSDEAGEEYWKARLFYFAF